MSADIFTDDELRAIGAKLVGRTPTDMPTRPRPALRDHTDTVADAAEDVAAAVRWGRYGFDPEDMADGRVVTTDDVNARGAMSNDADPLTDAEVDAIAAEVRRR